MPSTSSEDECKCKVSDKKEKHKIKNFLWITGKSRSRQKKRKRPSSKSKDDEVFWFLQSLSMKKRRINEDGILTSFYDPIEKKTLCESSQTGEFANGDFPPQRCETPVEEIPTLVINIQKDNTCYIDKVPEEILLIVFSYLPLAMLLLVVPHVCKKWKKLSMDWTLWKAVEHLRIKSMVVTTSEVRTLLRTIPKLKNLELVMRNDIEELLNELFQVSNHLEVLRLDRCTHSGLPLNIPPNCIKSILELCPKLKSVTLTDTHFRSRDFYKCLAQRFTTFERINISCTSKSEMKFFMDHLKSQLPGVEFQNVSMMGNADGKQIYWGPILGLVIRPNPTSPYHRQRTINEFPDYAF